MIGERIKSARRARGLSLRALATEVGVSAQAISKYERDQDTPGSGVLLRLAQALGVRSEYFFRQQQVNLRLHAYRKRATLPRHDEHIVLGQVREWLERYLEIESYFDHEAALRFHLPAGLPREVNFAEDAEQVAS